MENTKYSVDILPNDPLLVQGDCLQEMAKMPDSCVDLIVGDPPYFRVKSDKWDRQWSDTGSYLAWLDLVLAEWQRVLAPNGSLYCFCSPQMSARVEMAVSARFDVLNSIAWFKGNAGGVHSTNCKERLRRFFPATERIVFAELGGHKPGTYHKELRNLRGDVFEPLRAYLAGELKASGKLPSQIDVAWREMRGCRAGGMSGHWFGKSQWELPTEKNYLWLREILKGRLKREYDDLKREYDDLKRPFSVTKDVPYMDVWDMPVVQHYPGKHPCEKPMELLSHIVKTSSRPGDLVLDFAQAKQRVIGATQ